jgi:hypothetical protein
MILTSAVSFTRPWTKLQLLLRPFLMVLSRTSFRITCRSSIRRRKSSDIGTIPIGTWTSPQWMTPRGVYRRCRSRCRDSQGAADREFSGLCARIAGVYSRSAQKPLRARGFGECRIAVSTKQTRPCRASGGGKYLYASWQQGQYLRSMFSIHQHPS